MHVYKEHSRLTWRSDCCSGQGQGYCSWCKCQAQLLHPERQHCKGSQTSDILIDVLMDVKIKMLLDQDNQARGTNKRQFGTRGWNNGLGGAIFVNLKGQVELSWCTLYSNKAAQVCPKATAPCMGSISLALMQEGGAIWMGMRSTIIMKSSCLLDNTVCNFSKTRCFHCLASLPMFRQNLVGAQ